VRDWTVFNFGGTVVTGQTAITRTRRPLSEEVLPLFSRNCDAPLRVMRVPKRFRRYLIRLPQAGGELEQRAVTLLGDAAHPIGAVHRPGRGHGTRGCDLPRRDGDECNGDFPAAFRALPGAADRALARVQLSSLMMDKILPCLRCRAAGEKQHLRRPHPGRPLRPACVALYRASLREGALAPSA